VQVDDVTPLNVEEERGLPAQRPADVCAVLRRMIARFRRPWRQISKRISGVKCRCRPRKKSLTVKIVCSGLGENLDSPVVEFVVFRGKRILIDADFADGSFRRERTGRKAIYVNLAAVWAG